jgi:DNA-binding protein H-NS
MKDIDFQSMTIDELWALHETIASILSTRMKAEKLQLEKRIDELGQAPYKTSERRPYPKVCPKFRNPEPPHQTWSGRGKLPRWVSEMLEVIIRDINGALILGFFRSIEIRRTHLRRGRAAASSPAGLLHSLRPAESSTISRYIDRLIGTGAQRVGDRPHCPCSQHLRLLEHSPELPHLQVSLCKFGFG